MKRSFLLGYQILSGLSDSATGLLLLFAPALTLRLMRLHVASVSLPFLSFIGAFVLSVGLACLYGAMLATRLPSSSRELQVVWLLTAISRGCVALFVSFSMLAGTLNPGWLDVAVSDGALALLQIIGLSKGWLTHATA